MSKTWKIINISAVALWVALLFLLLYREHAGTPLEKQKAVKGGLDKATYWYDIYAGPKKIGFASTTIERVGEEIIIRHEREMKVARNGRETVLFDRLRCLTDRSFSMKSFEYASHFGDEKGTKVAGEVDSGEVLFFLESAEKHKTFKTPTNGKDFYLPITFISTLVKKKPAAGSTFTVPVLDLNSLTIKDVKVSLEEIRPIKVGINVFSLYKLRAGKVVWWSDEKGVIVKEENPMGFTLYSQVESFAKDPSDRILFDYTSLPFLTSDRLIQDSEGLKELKVRVKGLRLDPTIYENSRVTLNNGVLEIEKKDEEYMQRKTYTLPYKEDMSPESLNPDEWVLSNYEPLSNTGRTYAKSYGNDAAKFVNYLTGYLFRLIRTRPMFVLSDSISFLKSLSGDYLERTVMFATYARAAGLPVRLVSGLVYRDGYFYFHAWPEAWFDKWIPVDPTFEQLPADVTHIPLRTGKLKDIISVVDDLKSVSIEILEAS